MRAPDNDLHGLRLTFYDEADERLTELERSLLLLEQSGGDPELLNSIFRAVHSIKGGSAACDHSELASFAHAYESLLAALRKGLLLVDAELLDVLLQAKDVLDALVKAARDGDEGTEELRVTRAVAAIRGQLEAIPEHEPAQRRSDATVDFSVGFMIWDDVEVSLDGREERANTPSLPVLHPLFARASRPPRSSLAPRATQPPTSSLRPARARDSDRANVPLAPKPSSVVVPTVAPMVADSSASAVRSLDGVVVRVASQRFVLPTDLVECFLQPEAAAMRSLPTQGDMLVTSYGVLPIVCLETMLAMRPTDAKHSSRVAVLCRTEDRHVALTVDEVLTQGQVEVLSVDRNLPHVPGISGAVLFEEQLALVLEPKLLLAERARRLTRSRSDTND